MRIAFLCSSLEPGRDGVGDYSTLLAKECARQGHPTVLVALNDRHLEQAIQGTLSTITRDTSATCSPKVLYLRLPSVARWTERMAKAAAFLQDFSPNYISLQFVSYGFQNKGIVLGLEGLLSRLMASIQPTPRFHLMFHELWIGGSREAPRKDKMIGFIQRQAIRRLIRKMHPKVVHTTNPAYRAGLRQLQLEAKLLPLFGNIPITGDGTMPEWLLFLLQKQGVPVSTVNRTHFWICGIFGALHPEWSPHPLLSLLQEAAHEAGRDIIFLSLGKMGGGETVWQAMVQEHQGARREDRAEARPGIVYFAALGMLPEAQISDCLSLMDFSVATSPLGLLGKSGTVAAMWEHGLPVVVTRLETPFGFPDARAINDAGVDGEPKIYTLKDLEAFRQQLRHGFPRRAPASRLPEIANRFLNDLAQARLSILPEREKVKRP